MSLLGLGLIGTFIYLVFASFISNRYSRDDDSHPARCKCKECEEVINL